MGIPQIFKTSFRKRLTAILLLAALVPVLVFGGLIIHSSIRDSNENYRVTSLSVLNSVGRRLDDYIAQTEESLFFVLYDNNSTNEDLDAYSRIQQQLLYIRFLREEHESLLYYFPEREEVYIINNAGNRSFLDAGDIEETQWYRQAAENPGISVVLPLHYQTRYDKRYEISERVPVFTISRTFQLLNGETSVLAINSKTTGLAKICGAAESTLNESLTCLTSGGGLLYSTDPSLGKGDLAAISARILEEETHEGAFVLPGVADHSEHSIVYKISEDTGLITFKRVANSALNQYVAGSIQTMLGVMLVLVALIIPLGTLLSRSVTRPLSALESTMRKFGQGEMEARTTEMGGDEIGRIASAFNSMAEQIQALINERYALQLSRRTAQLYSLIAQINPHFLNNVLQSIGSAALEKDAPEIYEATTILAKMLRYSIKGKDMVTLKEELQNAANYLFIQKFRYEDALSYALNAEDGLGGVTMPKLTLQPLIENAVIHGLEAKKGMGTVAVSCTREGEGGMRIVVSDDGVGMEQEKLAAIREKCRRNDESIEIETSGIGLINVYQRLRIIYGDAFTMEIESHPEQGTTFTLHVPLSREGGESYA